MKRRCVIVAPCLLICALAMFFFTASAFARQNYTPSIGAIAPSSAIAGQGFTVVITGANFEVTSTVNLNNIALTVDGATTETITATASAGIFTTAGTLPLVISTSEGTASSNFQMMPATPQLSIAPATITIDAGNSTPFTATIADVYGNSVTTDTVQWSSSAGTFSANTGNTTTFTPPGTAGAYLVTATLLSTSQTVQRQVNVQAGPATQINLQPATSPININAGNTVMFTATLLDAASNPTTNGTVNWAASGGSFSGAGFTRVFSPTNIAGSYWVTTTLASNGQFASRQVIVSAANIAKITVSPPNATLPVNASQGFSAFAFDAFNNAVSNAAFNWSSADTTKATVIASGSTATLTAKTTAGVFAGLLRVNSGGITQTATLTITPGAPGSITLSPASASITVSTTQSFDATVFDAFGNVVPNTSLLWSVNGAQVGKITALDGDTAVFTSSTVAGVYPAGVRVSTGSITKTADITLSAGALNAVTLNPNGITILPSDSIGVVATGRDRFGNSISGLAFSWTVVGGAGTITPTSPGSASATFQASTVAGNYTNAVRASTNQGGINRTGTASVLISSDVVASIVVSPASANLQAATQQVFFARGYDKFNNLIWPLELSWAVSGTGLITKTGSVTATFEAGTVAGNFPSAITASTQGINGKADVTVVAGPLAAIDLSPSIVVVGIGSQQPFNAIGRDAFGNGVPGFSATWSVSPPSAGSFDSTSPTSALFRASNTPGTYNNVVRASSGLVSSAATVVVQPGTVASVSVTPASATVPINGTQMFTAIVRDQAGNPLPGLSVLWQVSPNAGSIVFAGPLTLTVKAGTSAGAFTGAVRAFNGVFNAAADLVIPAGEIASMNLSAAPNTLQTNGAASSVIDVLFTDAFGNPTGAGTTVQWEIVQCSGNCELSTASSQADASGHAGTSIRSDYRAPQGATSTIIVKATAGNVSKTVTLAGQFTPFTSSLPLMMREAPLNNHSSCTALVVAPPQTIVQAPDNSFNIYRFTANTNTYRISISNYATSGRILLYRIAVDNCATNGTLSVVYLGEAGITSSTLFETAFTNLFTPGQSYLLAVNTTGLLTSQTYNITIQP